MEEIADDLKIIAHKIAKLLTEEDLTMDETFKASEAYLLMIEVLKRLGRR